MNLPITPNAESIFNQCAKVNKRVATGVVPWYAIFEIVGESIDVKTSYPTEEKIDVTPENWVSTIWEPLVDYLAQNYAKAACFVIVEVQYTNAEGNFMSAPVFFKWCPDGVPVRSKMLLGSSFQSVKKKLDVQGTTPELSQRSELDINAFAEAAKIKGWVKL